MNGESGFKESAIAGDANGKETMNGNGKSGFLDRDRECYSGATKDRKKDFECYEIEANKADQNGRNCCCKLEKQLEHLGKGTTWLAIALGQVLATLLCVSAFATVHLVETYNIRIPNAQNFAFYMVLTTVFTTILAWRPADRNLFLIFRTRGWKYALVALADTEANFLITKAYQYTSVTSVQLLDCFAIPTVLSLSWLVLQIRFKVPHIIGVSLSLLGISCLVWAHTEGNNGSAKERFLGDMLCLAGAFLLGISHIAQEFVVKTFDSVEYLGMIGLFGSFVTGIQTVILEYGALMEFEWSMSSLVSPPMSLLVMYASSRLVFYMVTPIVIKYSSVTFLNLSLLSADFYTLIFTFKWHTLYFLSYALIMAGVLTFSIKPTVLGSHVLKSLTREITTTLDLELLASNTSTTDAISQDNNATTNGYQHQHSSNLEDSPVGQPDSPVVTEKSSLSSGHVHSHCSYCRKDGSPTGSPILSPQSFDMFSQTTVLGRGRKAFYLEVRSNSSSKIPEEATC